MHRFNVGDHVLIAESPVWDCPSGWADEMTKLCGSEATIVEVGHRSIDGDRRIRLDIDGGEWCWDYMCLTSVEDNEIPVMEDTEFAEAIKDLFD